MINNNMKNQSIKLLISSLQFTKCCGLLIHPPATNSPHPLGYVVTTTSYSSATNFLFLCQTGPGELQQYLHPDSIQGISTHIFRGHNYETTRV